MRKILLILCCFMITSCSYLHPYRPNIQQGNVISTTKVRQLHRGMSPSSVVSLMGSPILQNTFDNNRLTYIYTLNPNHGKTTYKQVTVTFRNNQLVSVEKK